MTDLILEKRDGAVLTIILNQPERRNPVSDNAVIDALSDALLAADADIDIRCVILTGAGHVFSSGGDLKQMKDGTGLRSDKAVQTRRNYRQGIQRLPILFEGLDIPVIAAVNGPAIGAGCDLALMCDIRIASDAAKFAESFVKLGIVPGDGGAWLLPRIVGFSRACEMALTGEMIDAHTALSHGLVSHVTAAEDLLLKAQEIAAKIAANPPHAVRMTKRLLRSAGRTDLATNLEMAAAMQSLAHATKDNAEAIDAFLEKRDPKFTGE
ncbi:crotonase/enoyl-CoA hydratase family protein [Sphingorhabdus arenilitoris]|uniref:Crotonase/enoyl-CoA hydratase family protein n=1 Tax=Sphingorhabdus arenilitoris TaxID=1490041 RepID=A0ABV8RK26_9SPHN